MRLKTNIYFMRTLGEFLCFDETRIFFILFDMNVLILLINFTFEALGDFFFEVVRDGFEKST
ncbi:hypothetical protein [Clostridium cellulovorans]|uniref:hypothetical protein n=1 Tax=Clostridium cellulovorans TaxID=1493 RepID=UPI001A995F7B|nr:hypothetical protein [Clostridium cellulovorans]